MDNRELKMLRKPIRRLSRVLKKSLRKGKTTGYEKDRMEVLTTEYFRLKEMLDKRPRVDDVATVLRATEAKWSKDYRVGNNAYSIVPRVIGGRRGDSIMLNIPSDVRGEWIDSDMLPTYVSTHDFIPSEARLWHSGALHSLSDKPAGIMEESWIVPEILTREMMDDLARGWAARADYVDNCEADDIALDEEEYDLEIVFIAEMLRTRLEGCERNLVKILASAAFGDDYQRSTAAGMDFRAPCFSKKLETGHTIEIGIREKFWANIDLLPDDAILAINEAHYAVLRPTVKWQISKSTLRRVI